MNPAELIRHDHWTAVSGESNSGAFILRFRQPLLRSPDVHGYPRCLRVVWAYDDADSGSLPTSRDSDKMRVFENRLCAAWEHDAIAVLTAVLTFDGARQWVFYTANVAECGARLTAMPQEAQRYPIELDAFDDAEWNYLRNEIVRDRASS